MPSRDWQSSADGVASMACPSVPIRIGRPLCLVLWLALVLAGSGCAGGYDSAYRYEQGWRLGRVVKVGDGLHFDAAGIDCRNARPDVGGEASGWAYLQVDFRLTARKYPHSGSSARYMIALIPAGVRLVPGDEVYVNIRDCGQAMVHPAHAREISSRLSVPAVQWSDQAPFS